MPDLFLRKFLRRIFFLFGVLKSTGISAGEGKFLAYSFATTAQPLWEPMRFKTKVGGVFFSSFFKQWDTVGGNSAPEVPFAAMSNFIFKY